MSYSMRPGRFKSHLTGREYQFVKDRDGSSKRAALAQLKADDTAVRAANNSRAAPIINRELTEREHKSGDWLPDSRTVREKVQEEVAHTPQQTTNPDHNPHVARISELQADLVHAIRPADKAKIQRRLDMARQSAAETDRQIAERKAREEFMASPLIQDARVDGKAWLARLQTNPAALQQWANDAKRRLEQLELTGDHETYWRETLVFEAERERILSERAAALDSEAASIKAEATTARREAVETPDPVTN